MGLDAEGKLVLVIRKDYVQLLETLGERADIYLPLPQPRQQPEPEPIEWPCGYNGEYGYVCY